MRSLVIGITLLISSLGSDALAQNSDQPFIASPASHPKTATTRSANDPAVYDFESSETQIVDQPLNYPYRTIGEVIFEKDARDHQGNTITLRWKCSAFLTGSNEVRTAGHCMYQDESAQNRADRANFNLHPDVIDAVNGARNGQIPKLPKVQNKFPVDFSKSEFGYDMINGNDPSQAATDWANLSISELDINGIKSPTTIGEQIGYFGMYLGRDRNRPGSYGTLLSNVSNTETQCQASYTTEEDRIKISTFDPSIGGGRDMFFDDPVEYVLNTTAGDDIEVAQLLANRTPICNSAFWTEGGKSELKVSSCGVAGKSNNMFAHNCDHGQGTSGSPLFFKMGSQYVAFAIQSGNIRPGYTQGTGHSAIVSSSYFGNASYFEDGFPSFNCQFSACADQDNAQTGPSEENRQAPGTSN